jgi:hypothetical protein
MPKSYATIVIESSLKLLSLLPSIIGKRRIETNLASPIKGVSKRTKEIPTKAGPSFSKRTIVVLTSTEAGPSTTTLKVALVTELAVKKLPLAKKAASKSKATLTPKTKEPKVALPTKATT